jgi:cell division septum initiation protein DivIVA
MHMENQFRGISSSPAAAGSINEQLGDKATQAKDAVVDFGRKTVDNLDAQRGPAAGTLDQTASLLHAQADRVAGAARATADKLHATASRIWSGVIRDRRLRSRPPSDS